MVIIIRFRCKDQDNKEVIRYCIAYVIADHIYMPPTDKVDGQNHNYLKTIIKTAIHHEHYAEALCASHAITAERTPPSHIGIMIDYSYLPPFETKLVLNVP